MALTCRSNGVTEQVEMSIATRLYLVRPFTRLNDPPAHNVSPSGETFRLRICGFVSTVEVNCTSHGSGAPVAASSTAKFVRVTGDAVDPSGGSRRPNLPPTNTLPPDSANAQVFPSV